MKKETSVRKFYVSGLYEGKEFEFRVDVRPTDVDGRCVGKVYVSGLWRDPVRVEIIAHFLPKKPTRASKLEVNFPSVQYAEAFLHTWKGNEKYISHLTHPETVRLMLGTIRRLVRTRSGSATFFTDKHYNPVMMVDGLPVEVVSGARTEPIPVTVTVRGTKKGVVKR